MADIGPEGGLSDVDFIRSTDGGLTWSNRIQINDDEQANLNWQFHPWMIVNEDGVIICVFYDERFDVNNYNFDLLAAYSFDGGKTFTSNHRISSVSSPPNNAKEIPNNEPVVQPTDRTQPALVMSPQAGKIGEYIGVTAYYDKINAVWTDTRDGNQEVYTANWQMPMLEPRLQSPVNGALVKASVGLGVLPPKLEWSTSWKENDDRYQIEWTGSAGGSGTWTSTTNSFTAWAGDPPMPMVYAEGWYLWRVRTLNTAGTDSSAWSEYWMFYLDATPPAQPSLLSPSNGATLSDRTPLLDWSIAMDNLAVTYDMYLSTDPAFAAGPATTVYTGLTDTQYQIATDLALSPYYWKVTATDAVGWTSSSTVGSFVVDTSCCSGSTGNVNDGVIEQPDLSDLSLLISYLIQTPRPALPCLAEANIDATGSIDLTDLSMLISRLTGVLLTLPNCP